MGRGRGTHSMDCLSSATWAATINSEIKSRKIWKEKYGHQFDIPDSVENSRAPTAMSQQPPATGRASQMSRPATGMSQASTGSQSAAKRKQLMDLKKKLMSALEEVDCELAETQDFGSTRGK